MKASSQGKKAAPAVRRSQVGPKEPNPELEALLSRTKDEVQRLEKKARAGERLESMWKDGAYAIINEEILVPFETEIVNCLKNPNFDIENKGQLYQFQASLKAINQIRERWERRIKEGVDARIQIAQLQQGTAPQEGT